MRRNPRRVLDSSCFTYFHQTCIFQPVFHGSFCVVPTAKAFAGAYNRISHMLQKVIKQPCVSNVLSCLSTQSRSSDWSSWLRFALVHYFYKLQLRRLVPSNYVRKTRSIRFMSTPQMSFMSVSGSFNYTLWQRLPSYPDSNYCNGVMKIKHKENYVEVRNFEIC